MQKRYRQIIKSDNLAIPSFILQRFSTYFLIKPVELLRNLISCYGYLSSALSRQVDALAQKAPAEPQIQLEILLF